MERDALGSDKECLTAKMKPLERQAQRAKAPGARAPGPMAEGEAEGPTVRRVVGGGGVPNAAGIRFLLAGAQAWHTQAEAAHGQMSAVTTEGYTPAARLRRALGIIPSAKKTCNSLLLHSLLFDTPSLCTLQHVLGDSFSFFEPPPPPPPLTCVCWGLGLG